MEAIDWLVRERARLLVVQRTGWGKSLVYFLATRRLRNQGAGPPLLISPLLALMRNQLMAAEPWTPQLSLLAQAPTACPSPQSGATKSDTAPCMARQAALLRVPRSERTADRRPDRHQPARPSPRRCPAPCPLGLLRWLSCYSPSPRSLSVRPATSGWACWRRGAGASRRGRGWAPRSRLVPSCRPPPRWLSWYRSPRAAP